MPTNLGDWPLTIVVMVFAFAMFRLAVASIKHARDEYSADLATQRADHAKAMDEQRHLFLESWSKHIQAMATELTRLATITQTMNTELTRLATLMAKTLAAKATKGKRARPRKH